MISNFPDYFKTVRFFFQMTANFLDYFKTVQIFPDHFQFSGWFQNCPDNSRWLPIFPDDFKTLRIFTDGCQFSRLFQNCPDFSRWLPNFRIISKRSGFFQVIANFPDDSKSVLIFPIAQKTGIFGSETPFFIYFSPFWSTLWPFWSLFNTQTPF